MAQLPPKIPNMTPDWTDYGHPLKTTSLASWIDDFVDLASTKRGGNRRCDSEAFVVEEEPICRERSSVVAMPEFDRLDDHHLVSMFSDIVNAGINIPSNCQQPENKVDVKNEPSPENTTTAAAVATDSTSDPKRVKRILANRQSAQRSRVRKLQYISELERSVTYLQTEVSSLSPRVAFFDHQRSILSAANSALRQRMAFLSQDKLFKDAQQEALRKEIERLSQVYHRQNQKKMSSSSSSSSSANTDPTSCSDNQLTR